MRSLYNSFFFIHTGTKSGRGFCAAAAKSMMLWIIVLKVEGSINAAVPGVCSSKTTSYQMNCLNTLHTSPTNTDCNPHLTDFRYSGQQNLIQVSLP